MILAGEAEAMLDRTGEADKVRASSLRPLPIELWNEIGGLVT